MEPTRSERRGAPTVASILLMVLVGVGTLTYDALHQPPTFATAVQSQVATALAPDPMEADKACLAETATKKYGGRDKGFTYFEGNALITNLSLNACKDLENKDIAAQGYCVAQGKCRADTCGGKPCATPTGTTPSTGTPTPTPPAGTTPTPTAPTSPAPTQPFGSENISVQDANKAIQDGTQQRLENVNSQIENCAYGGCSPETVKSLDVEKASLQQTLSNLSNNTSSLTPDQFDNVTGVYTGSLQKPAAQFPTPGNDTFNYSTLPTGSSPSGYFPQGNAFEQFSPAWSPGGNPFNSNDAAWAQLPQVPGTGATGNVPGYGLTNFDNLNPSNAVPFVIPNDANAPQPPPSTDKPATVPPGNNVPKGAERPGPSGPASPGDSKAPSGSPGGLDSLLKGLMQGLGKGLGQQSPQQAPAQACSTDSNTYAQQQQQYQQQLQQYNYQLQQYQYQQQLAQYQSAQYGGYSTAPTAPPPIQPTPCTPSTTQQCTSQPQQPAASTCNNGQWRPTYAGSCITSWQCSNLGANLSCIPEVADVGTLLTLTYSCAQGTASGNGFTASSSSGVATTTIATPPLGANTATYSLTCSNGTATSGAQCSVQVSQPNIVLVANPATVSAGNTSLLGWITTWMRSCIISAPADAAFTAQNASNTSVSGSVQTPALQRTTEFDLTCTTLSGNTRIASTTVMIPGTTPASEGGGALTATSTADGGTLHHGDTVTISWQSSGEPAGAKVSLWLYDLHANTLSALIAGAQPLSGSYTWTVPGTTSTCPSDGSFNVCGADLVAGRQYSIEADVYTPGNAYVGDGPPPANPIDPAYGDFYDTLPFTVAN